MAVQYAPLFALETQFQAKNGRNLTGGFLRVLYAATDDPADTYSDYNLTRNPEIIVLDDNGRAIVICDKSKAYRLEVYDAEGMIIWTEEPVYCSGTGGGGVSITKVISTDGSISIDESVAGSTTTYDIGLAPRDSDEFLEWIKCSEEDCGSTWYPVYQEGTMETEAGQGIKVHKGQLYHFTNTFYIDPDGTGLIYDTFKVNMYCNDEIVDSRNFNIDTSVNDVVQCEFSTDVIPADDGHVYFKLTIPATCEATGEVQAHRIYSGINAVPDTCATKQWVQETFDYNLSSKVDYSAIEYNQYNEITGISGSAIAGGINSAMVSSIASSVASAYTESAFSSISAWTADFSSISSKADSSSLSAYQPVSAMSGYATEAYVDAKVGDKLDATASSLFLTGLPDDLATTGDVASAVSGKMDKADGSAFYPMTGNPSGFLTAHQSLAGLATVEYVDSSVSSKLDTSAFASASAGFAPSGDYMSATESSNFILTSQSGMFAPSGAYQDQSAMSAYVPFSSIAGDGGQVTSIDGSAFRGHEYSGLGAVVVDNTADTISIRTTGLAIDADTMSAWVSGDDVVIGVKGGVFAYESSNSAKLDTSAFSSVSGTFLTAVPAGYATESYVDSAVSGKLDATASSQFITSTAGLATTGDVASAVSSKLDATASSQFLTSIPSDYATTAYVDSSISGFAYESAVSGWTAKQDALTYGYDTANKISSIDGSALAGEGGLVTSLQYYTSGATSTGTGTAIGRTNAGNSTGSINYYTLDFGEHSPSCITAIKYSQILITADKNSDFVTAWPLVSPDLSAFAIYKSVADTAAIGSVPASASSYVGKFSTTTSDLGTGVRFNLTGNNFSSIKTSEENVLVLAYRYMPDNWSTLIVTGTTGSFNFNYENSEGYTAVSGINELGIYVDTSNCYPTSNPSGFISSVDLSNYATTAYVDSSVSSKLDATASSQFITSTAGLATTADISGFAYESAVSGWTAKQDALTFGYDTANNISSIDGSAIGGQGGINSATCSAIASAYAESAISSVSGDYYTTANESGYALSSDVSATVDLVSTQSANWGGSALALSAGPGVKLEKVGNTLVASTDRTLLWSGDIIANQIAQLSEPHTRFEMLEIHHSYEGSSVNRPVISYIQCGYAYTVGENKVIGVVGPALSLKPWESNNIYEAFGCYVTNTSATNDDQIRLKGAKVLMNGGISNTENLYHCYAIYGINRTAEA